MRTPEEQELERKKSTLAELEAQLADRELERASLGRWRALRRFSSLSQNATLYNRQEGPTTPQGKGRQKRNPNERLQQLYGLAKETTLADNVSVRLLQAVARNRRPQGRHGR
jgi:hypothetical protein